jgi:hypothetical protein
VFLKWQIERGRHEDFLIGIAQNTGKTPASLRTRPVLSLHLFPIWKAFGILSSSRQIGMTPGPIPYSEISAYYFDFGYESGFDLPEFIRLIMEVDNEYLSILESRSKKK